jgi:hypothetical protein
MTSLGLEPMTFRLVAGKNVNPNYDNIGKAKEIFLWVQNEQN